MELDREELAALVRAVQDVDPLRARVGPFQAQPLDHGLVVGYRDRDVDEAVAQARSRRDAGGVVRRVQPQREAVARDACLRRVAREHRECDGLAAVPAKAQLLEDLEGRVVVPQIRAAETDRRDARAREDLGGLRDRLALPAAVQDRVVAVHESVQRELRPAVGIAAEQSGVAGEHARGGGPGRPDPEIRQQPHVAIEPPGHPRGGDAEAREHRRGPRGGARGSARAQAHREAHASSLPSAATGSMAATLPPRAAPSTTATYRGSWRDQR